MSDPTTTLCIFASAYFIYMSSKQDDLEIIMHNNSEGLTNGTITSEFLSKTKVKKYILPRQVVYS